jgi:hypothetical protein
MIFSFFFELILYRLVALHREKNRALLFLPDLVLNLRLGLFFISVRPAGPIPASC